MLQQISNLYGKKQASRVRSYGMLVKCNNALTIVYLKWEVSYLSYMSMVASFWEPLMTIQLT
ncbi:hypothetical protein ACHAXS_004233 [Conticribra weissflogii]